MAPRSERINRVMVRKLRLRRGLTQVSLAQRIGRARETIARIENGKIEYPQGKTVTDMAQALEVDREVLLLPA
jgi:transcriptional regulator with XRE-family HTH domain